MKKLNLAAIFWEKPVAETFGNEWMMMMMDVST